MPRRVSTTFTNSASGTSLGPVLVTGLSYRPRTSRHRVGSARTRPRRRRMTRHFFDRTPRSISLTGRFVAFKRRRAAPAKRSGGGPACARGPRAETARLPAAPPESGRGPSALFERDTLRLVPFGSCGPRPDCREVKPEARRAGTTETRRGTSAVVPDTSALHRPRANRGNPHSAASTELLLPSEANKIAQGRHSPGRCTSRLAACAG